MTEVAALPPAPTGPAGPTSGASRVRLLPGELSFQTLVDFAHSIRRVKGRGSQARKEAMVQGFIQDNIVRESGQAWDVFRLLLPHLDMHRPPYMLQEARLSTALLRAAAIPEGSDRWRRIKGWVDPTLADKHTVGQFAEALCKSLFNDHCSVAPGTSQARLLKVAHVNGLLDRLSAASGDTDLVVPLLRELYQRTTPQQLQQLVQIIQRDYRIQLSETFIFPHWHPDAEVCYAHCFDARQVFNQLCDPSQPFEAKLDLGQCAQPQLSLAMYSSRALVENMQQLEAKAQAASAPEPTCANAGITAGVRGGNFGGSGGKNGGTSGLPTNGSRGGARGIAAVAGQQAGPVQFLVEIKLDGERQQIHMPADPSQPCNYFSRRGIDHGPTRELQGGGNFRCFDPVVRAQVRAQGAILDGELLNWNRRRRRFEVFGSWRAVVRALNGGAAPTDPLDCTDYEGNLNVEDADWEAPLLEDLEACYVCWDILWADGRQLSQLPLLERHRLLRQAICPAPPEGIPLVPTNPSAPRRGALLGRIVLLLPGEACYPGVPVPRVCSTVLEVDAAIKEVLDKRMEGIVAKRLTSPWLAGDRSGNWVKFKPDYVRKVGLDGVIIGVCHGERERSGKYGEYLLGIRCCPPRCPGNAGRAGGGAGTSVEDASREGIDSGASGATHTWASFVKVGAGLRMAEMEQLTAILEPNTCQQPPPCYRLTGHHKERPHLYIKNPLESVVLEVQADLRLVCSTYYASEYSLRFPRVERIRWDKGALQASDEEELRSRATCRKERLQQEEFRYVQLQAKWETMRTSAKARKALESEAPRRRGRLALGACPDTVKAHSSALKDCCLFILNYAGHDQQHCQKLVRQMGGGIWSVGTFEPARVGSSYTHVLAGAPVPAPGSRPGDCTARNWLRAVESGCDVLSLGWLAACFAGGHLVEPAAADYLQMSAVMLQRHPSWDPFGDDYFCKATAGDVAATLLRMPAAEALEAGGALKGWLDGQLARVAALTQQHPGVAASSDCGQGREMPEDECLLLRCISGLAAGHTGGARLATELVVGVDAELAALGLLDACALMHGCRVAVVPLLQDAGRQWQLQGVQAGATPQLAGPPAAACTGLLAGVAQLQAEAQRSQARLAGYAGSSLAGLVASHGGSLSSSVDDGTTHLLVVQPPAWPCTPARVALAEGIAALAAAAEEMHSAADQAGQPAAAGAAPMQAQPAASLDLAGRQPVTAAGEAPESPATESGEVAERSVQRRAALLAAAAKAAAGCVLPPVEPATLLAAVSRQVGGPAAVAALRRRLEAGQLAVVAPSWVEASVEAATQRAGLPLPPADESEHALLFAGGAAAAAADWRTWPWERFAAACTLAAGAADAATSGPDAEPAGEQAAQAHTVVAEAASRVLSRSAAAPPGPAVAAAAPTPCVAPVPPKLGRAEVGEDRAAAPLPAAGHGTGPPVAAAAAAAPTAAAAAAPGAAAVAAPPAVGSAAPQAVAGGFPQAVARGQPHAAGAEIQVARRAGGFERWRRGGAALQAATAAARTGTPPAAGGSPAPQQPQVAWQVRHPAQHNSQPHQATEQQQAGKRRRIISGGLPREQQAGRRRSLHQQGPAEPQQRGAQPQQASEQSRQVQHAAQREGSAAPVRAQAQGVLQAPHATQVAAAPAPAPAMPSMFDLLFSGDQPGEGCRAAGAAADGAAVREQAGHAPGERALAPAFPPAALLPAPTAAWPLAALPGATSTAPQQERRDACQARMPQCGDASVPGSQEGRQPGTAAGPGLRGRVATLQALSQRREEERTRRQVAEASQDWSQAP